ncbi:N-acetylneuraminate synthase family protein [Alphaproteobacteria bacterium]|nr:N-acetylneuraminate synthase family protein [Alphaproteobacteria bacterium]
MMAHRFTIENKEISSDSDTYFIADIAANHDGDLVRAKDLIYRCAEAGADAAKFQHFTAETIVSDRGFKALGRGQSHQSNWQKSVFDVYHDASIDQDWTLILKETCNDAGITFLTSPYSYDLVDKVDEYVNAYKIGSGDITWTGIIEHIASKNKPIILATGASTLKDVDAAMSILLEKTNDIVLMQCNTNYTASVENFKYINLNVLKLYKSRYPGVVLGLSDHTPGHATVLGAVALGARVIEKHFTDDTSRAGPDHKFSMDSDTWRVMVDRTRELEHALGCKTKKIEDNETETVVRQRRAIRATRNLVKGDIINEEVLTFLRPCPEGGLAPYELSNILNKKLTCDVLAGECITWSIIE